MTAQKLSSHEARDTSRLSPKLLYKQQVAASKCTGTTEASYASRGVSAQGGAQLIIDAAQAPLASGPAWQG